MSHFFSLVLWFFACSLTMATIPLFLGIGSTTVYLHRSATHGAVIFAPGWRRFLKLCVCVTTGIKDHEWVPVHRKHHKYTDKPGDPHSPLIFGFWPIQIGNVIKYREGIAALTADDWRVFGLKAEPDPAWDWFFENGQFGLTLGTFVLNIICVLIWGRIGIAIGLMAALMHAVLYVFVLTSSINGLCHFPHWSGYQHTKAAHAITTFNNWIVALLTAGEGFHWDHHCHPTTARLAGKWWEVPADWGYWLWIVPIETLGGCTVLHRKYNFVTETVTA